MFGQYQRNNPNEHSREVKQLLAKVADLINEHFGELHEPVRMRLPFNELDKVAFVLLNKNHSCRTNMYDVENEDIIRFFNYFHYSMTKEMHAEHTKWSYSVFTFNATSLQTMWEMLGRSEMKIYMLRRCDVRSPFETALRASSKGWL